MTWSPEGTPISMQVGTRSMESYALLEKSWADVGGQCC